MPKNRLPIAVGAFAVGSLLLAGCATSAAPVADVAIAKSADISSCDPTESVLNVTFGTQAAEAMTIAVANLKAEYPGLEINAEPQATSSYDDLTKTIVADIAVGKRPDLIMTGLGQLRFWTDTY